LLSQVPAEVRDDPMMKAMMGQLLSRVEKDEGTRSLVRTILDSAARDWPVGLVLVCPKCGRPVKAPQITSSEHVNVFCDTCKIPYTFFKELPNTFWIKG